MRVTTQCDELGKLTVPTLETYDYGKDKQAILDYMNDRKLAVAASSARVYDYVTSQKYDKYCRIDYTDKNYEWTTNDILYVELYDMAINEDFIKQITKAETKPRKTRTKTASK